jgi:hypothetical protein
LDIIYKYRADLSHWHELRYSLRSLSNLTDKGKVYIVGDLPQWACNVVHIPCDDPYKDNKDANLIRKLLKACDSDISDDFMQMSDDMLIMNKTPCNAFTEPVFMETWKASGRWKKRLENTQKVLKDLGLPAKIFEAHCPYVINKLTYPEIMCKFTWDKDILGNTLYFNYLKKEGQKGSVVRFRGYDKWKYNGEDVINYNDGGLTGEFKAFVSEAFPKKCEYERDEIQVQNKRRKTTWR